MAADSTDPTGGSAGGSAGEPPRRQATICRETAETMVSLAIDLDGTGQTNISTGVPFFDHMLDQIGRHGGFDLSVETKGDVEVDAHHTVEDTSIVLGQAFAEALGSKSGVRRFASGRYPLDEALVSVALDLSGRPYFAWDVAMPSSIGLGTTPFDPTMAEHALGSFATSAMITLHVTGEAGTNAHHVIEAAFKGVARCLRDAVRVEYGTEMPSTKGSL